MFRFRSSRSTILTGDMKSITAGSVSLSKSAWHRMKSCITLSAVIKLNVSLMSVVLSGRVTNLHGIPVQFISVVSEGGSLPSTVVENLRDVTEQ